eukprot:270087_1
MYWLKLALGVFLITKIKYGVCSLKNLPYSEISKYNGETWCNSVIARANVSKSDKENFKYDTWTLNMDDSACINIWTNYKNISLINIYDCLGSLIDPPNDYLASNKCKFTYFVQLRRMNAYKLKILCYNSTQCDKTMRRLHTTDNDNGVQKIGYLRQLINLLSDSNSESDSDSDSDDSIPTNTPSIPPSNEPSNAPSRNPSRSPSNAPSRSPSNAPSRSPSNAPSRSPSNAPSRSPSNPSRSPSNAPSRSPSKAPNPIICMGEGDDCQMGLLPKCCDYNSGGCPDRNICPGV